MKAQIVSHHINDLKLATEVIHYFLDLITTK